MILEYHRPQNISDAIWLLSRKDVTTIPLAGGTTFQQIPEGVSVVDLQSLGLNLINIQSGYAELGSMLTFQQVMNWENAPEIMRQAVYRGATYNQRNQVTIGGAVASTNSFSPLLAALLALDAKLTWQPNEIVINLGEWYPLKKSLKPGKLITSIGVPINIQSTMQIISRTPADHPQILACGCRWSSGRTRIVVMIKECAPVLLSDGRGEKGLENSIINIECNDQNYSREYVENSLKVLIRRVLKCLDE